MKKAILYINQFFGQIGGEDKADVAPENVSYTHIRAHPDKRQARMPCYA